MDIASVKTDRNFNGVLRMDHLDLEEPTRDENFRFSRTLRPLSKCSGEPRRLKRKMPRGRFPRGVLSQFIL
jgi:hypothetical protein